MCYVKGEHDEYVRDGAVTGFDLKRTSLMA
jgi:hypothetical protein